MSALSPGWSNSTHRYDELTPEEREYSELLAALIEAFETVNYALEASTSDSRLRSLMKEHGLRQRDLLHVLLPATSRRRL